MYSGTCLLVLLTSAIPELSWAFLIQVCSQSNAEVSKPCHVDYPEQLAATNKTRSFTVLPAVGSQHVNMLLTHLA